VEAYNRRDLEAVVATWHPEFEYRRDPKWVAAGLVEPCYRGFAGYRRYVATADEVWGGANYLKLLEVFDLGERLVMLAEGSMRDRPAASRSPKPMRPSTPGRMAG